MSLSAAQQVNAWFLATVALWRVALLVWFLRSVARLSGITIVVATLLPLTLIVVALALLNLEHVVFDIMAGIRPEQRSVNDLAYTVVAVMAVFSYLAAPVLLIGYMYVAIRVRLSVWRAREPRRT